MRGPLFLAILLSAAAHVLFFQGYGTRRLPKDGCLVNVRLLSPVVSPDDGRPEPDGVPSNTVFEDTTAAPPLQKEMVFETDGKSDSGEKQLAEYCNDIRDKFAGMLHYPRSAMERGLQGTVLLRFYVDAEGYMTKTEIAESSGIRVLDDSAMKTASKIKRVSPPVDYGLDPLTIEIGLNYKLNERRKK